MHSSGFFRIKLIARLILKCKISGSHTISDQFLLLSTIVLNDIYIYISLSTIVLNSRDWSEIIWLSKISRFKNQPCNMLYLKKPTVMHWLGYNDAVSWLNKAKTQIFQPTANFKIFKIYLYFICLPACLPACHKTRLR